MEYNLEKPLFTLTIGEYINLNKQLMSFHEQHHNRLSTAQQEAKKNEILIDEASKLTGLAISTIRTKCHLNEIPFHKPKGTKLLRFKRNELIDWMNSNKFKTISEEENDFNTSLANRRNKNKSR